MNVSTVGNFNWVVWLSSLPAIVVIRFQNVSTLAGSPYRGCV
jgi:hypothetical protein